MAGWRLCSTARSPLSRNDFAGREFDAEWALGAGTRPDHRRHAHARRRARAVPGAGTDRTVPDGRPGRPGLAAEDEALADLIMSRSEFRAGVYAFNLTQKRARKPAGAPDAGAGPHGDQGRRDRRRADGRARSPCCSPGDCTCRWCSPTSTRPGWTRAWPESAGRSPTGPAKKQITRDEANRLTALVTGSLDYQAFSDADFVIEAVFEELGVKKEVFAELEKVVGPDAVLATNTSSLSVTEMAADLEHPERVVGFHFFNPVAVMPLLEIVRTASTTDATAGNRFGRGQGAEEGPDLDRRRTGVRGEPAADRGSWARSSRPSTRAPTRPSPTARWPRSGCR